jgi:hypothetical protein
MIRKLFIALSLVFTACLVHAQTSTAISASDVADSFGHPIPSANLCFQPVDATDTATGFRVDSIQVVDTPVCGLVSNGVLQAGLSVVPTPSGIYYHITAQNRTSNAVIRDYGMTAITGSSWALDTYDPNMAVLPVTALSMGTVTTLPPGEGASCGLSGTNPILLNCSIPQGETGAVGNVNGQAITPSTTTTAVYDTGGEQYDISAYGAPCNGIVDDTPYANLAVAALNAAGQGRLFFPAGICNITTLDTITATATISGVGPGSNDQGSTISQIQCNSATGNCITDTAAYLLVKDIVITNSVGEAGTEPTSGYGIEFNPGGSYYDQKMSMEDVEMAGFKTAVYAVDSEAGHINGSSLFDCYYDCLLLGNGTSNLGDWSMSDDTFTGAGGSCHAAIDYEGAAGGDFDNLLFDQGISAHNADCAYDIYAGVGGPYRVASSHFEHYKTRAYYGQAPAYIGGNDFYTTDSPYGPAIEITGALGSLTFGTNYFQDGNSSPDACAIQFDGSSFSDVVVAIQNLDGYTAGTCGMAGWWGIDGNADMSTLQNYMLPSLTLNAASGSAGLLTTNGVVSPTGYPLVIGAASGQQIRLAFGGTNDYLIGATYISPAVDDAVNMGSPGNAFSYIDAYALLIGSNTVLPSTLTGYNGNSSGTKVPLALPWSTPSAIATICHDANGNVLDSGCPSGEANVTGLRYGNGTGADTAATSSQIQTVIGSGVYDASGAAAARAAASTCTSGQYATGTGTSSTPCAQVAYSQISGTPTPTLSGTAVTLGGSSVSAHTCTSGTTTVTGATTSMPVVVSAASDPGGYFTYRGTVTSSGTVTVYLCNVNTSTAETPTSTTYIVRVIE